MRPSRRVSLRLGSARRHDGVLGGSVLRAGGSRGGLRGRALRGGGLRVRPARGVPGNDRGLAARPVSLRLGSGRRSGALGVLPGRRSPWARSRLGGGRRATLRVRSAVPADGYLPLGRRTRLRAGRRGRLTGSSFLATWTGGLLGGRSAARRIGGKRTGGLR
jgi:hypothetical protein